jgi:predicted O-linked N-acetylglucosamine transferase (SPINDLY family)
MNMQIDAQVARNYLLSGQFELAISQYQELISLTPLNAVLYLELSSALMGLGKLDEALVVVNQTENLDAAILHEAKLQRGNIFLAQGRYLDALAILSPLLSTHCGERARTALSTAYINIGKPSKASEVLDVIEREKLSIGAINNLAISLCEQMRVTEALEILAERIQKGIFDFSTISNILMLSNYYEAPEKYIVIAKHALKHTEKLTHIPPAKNKSPGHPWQIGFISGDMRQHPVGWFFVALLKELSAHYKTVVYYTNHQIDPLTQTIISTASEFRFIGQINDGELINQMKQDGNDVLIDLSGHTAGGRLQIFNQRIAPKQLSYLGYFSSTYMPEIDGVIFDKKHLDGVPNDFFTEKVYELECSRFNYTAPYAIEIAPLPALQNKVITFGSFCNTSKISQTCLNTWATTLKAIPKSKLQLRWKSLQDPQVRKSIRNTFIGLGIENTRVELYSDCDHESLFHFYNEVDIALDTFPFSGATTCCEALWMGVPVLTRTGSTPASNQAASILHQIDLDEYITTSAEEFTAQAIKLTSDLEALSQLRASIRKRFLTSSLGSPAIFAKHFVRLIEEITTT